MPRHVEAWLDGVSLSTVGPFLIQSVTEEAPALGIGEYERPGRHGSGVSGIRRQSLKVSLELAVRERFYLAGRSGAQEALAAWARGSVLMLSSRPQRLLRVRCTGVPALGNIRNYTEIIKIEFTAFEVPYWEDQVPTRLALSYDPQTPDTGAGSLYVPGTADTPVCVSVTPLAALTELTVSAGGSTVALTGLNVAAGETLRLTRDVLDNLAILHGQASVLPSRTAASADDLLVQPGLAAVVLTADAPLNVDVYVKGRWL